MAVEIEKAIVRIQRSAQEAGEKRMSIGIEACFSVSANVTGDACRVLLDALSALRECAGGEQAASAKRDPAERSIRVSVECLERWALYLSQGDLSVPRHELEALLKGGWVDVIGG